MLNMLKVTYPLQNVVLNTRERYASFRSGGTHLNTKRATFLDKPTRKLQFDITFAPPQSLQRELVDASFWPRPPGRRTTPPIHKLKTVVQKRLIANHGPQSAGVRAPELYLGCR